jgi:hypothetical protein
MATDKKRIIERGGGARWRGFGTSNAFARVLTPDHSVQKTSGARSRNCVNFGDKPFTTTGGAEIKPLSFSIERKVRVDFPAGSVLPFYCRQGRAVHADHLRADYDHIHNRAVRPRVALRLGTFPVRTSMT